MFDKILSEMTDEEVLAAITSLRERRATAREARATQHATKSGPRKKKEEEDSTDFLTLLNQALAEESE